MTFSVRRTMLAALLGTGFVAGSIYADAEPPMAGSEAITKKDLDTTNTLLTELKKQLTELKTKEIAELSEKIDALKTKELQALKSDVEQLKTAKKQTLETLEGTDQGDGLLKRMTTLENKLKALSNQVEQLDRKLDSTRTSLSSPLANPGANRLVKSGTVKLLNLYATDVDILVNGVAYRLSPNETRTLSLAPGAFTYQLLTGGGQEISRTIKESEEVLLKVN